MKKSRNLELKKAYKVLNARFKHVQKKLKLNFISFRGHLGIKNKGIGVALIYADRNDNLSTSLCAISIHHVDLNSLPDISHDDGVKLLLECSENYNIFVGFVHPVKILDKGETLENLLIEHDMKFKN